MPHSRFDNVINRWGGGSTIDDIHQRTRDKGTFDKNDLYKIVIHYNTIDPKGIRENADNLNRLYRKLDTIGKFSNIVPEPNSVWYSRSSQYALLQFDEHGNRVARDGRYVPGIIYGSATNAYHVPEEGYIMLIRFDRLGNEGLLDPKNTGYEIEFFDDDEYLSIRFSDVPKTP